MSNDTKIRPLDYVAGVDELLADVQSDLSDQSQHDMCNLLAAYLRKKMREHGLNVKLLAKRLTCPVDYVRVILDARLPVSIIDRYFLETLADVFKEEPATIFALVSRTFYSEDNREDMIAAKTQLSEYILSEVNNLLFAAIDERYTDDSANVEVYDQVIGELQRIIARQRRDLRFIEGLLGNLPNPNLGQVLNQDLVQITAEPDEQTIIYMKKNLERIVKHFGGVGEQIG